MSSQNEMFNNSSTYPSNDAKGRIGLMKIALLFLVSALAMVFLNPNQLGAVTRTEPKYRTFDISEYASPELVVSQSEFKHGDIIINIIQVKRVSNFFDRPQHCRAWLEIKKSEHVILQKYYDDIGPVGFSYGIVVPKIQPPWPYFAIVKNGDYDGRLFLLRDNGDLFDLIGGFYFLTEDKRYLFSQYVSDLSGLVVVDLNEGEIVFESKNLPYAHQWYKKNGDYFFTESEWLPENLGRPTEKEGTAFFYDFISHKIIRRDISRYEISSAQKVTYDFDPRKHNDCGAPNSE